MTKPIYANFLLKFHKYFFFKLFSLRLLEKLAFFFWQRGISIAEFIYFIQKDSDKHCHQTFLKKTLTMDMNKNSITQNFPKKNTKYGKKIQKNHIDKLVKSNIDR